VFRKFLAGSQIHNALNKTTVLPWTEESFSGECVRHALMFSELWLAEKKKISPGRKKCGDKQQ